MSDCINQTLNGLANQRKEILAIANEFPEQDIRVGLTVFDHNVIIKYRNLSVTELSRMDGFHYYPNGDRKSTRLNSSHNNQSRMPSSA